MQSLETKSSRPRSFETEMRPETFETETSKKCLDTRLETETMSRDSITGNDKLKLAYVDSFG